MKIILASKSGVRKKIMEENKKLNVNKKKSKFQLRLEDAMKANQAAQRSKGKKK